MWALGTWSHIRRIRVSEHLPDALYCYDLALSGSMLLCGGTCKDEKSGIVMVLDADTLRCQHTLLLDHPVNELLSVRGEVWGSWC